MAGQRERKERERREEHERQKGKGGCADLLSSLIGVNKGPIELRANNESYMQVSLKDSI
jgi:hypothetical protein